MTFNNPVSPNPLVGSGNFTQALKIGNSEEEFGPLIGDGLKGDNQETRQLIGKKNKKGRDLNDTPTDGAFDEDIALFDEQEEIPRP